jgi:hypothetical protein
VAATHCAPRTSYGIHLALSMRVSSRWADRVLVIEISPYKILLKNPSDLRRPHDFWRYDQASQLAKGEEDLAQSTKLLTSLPSRASDSRIVRFWTRSSRPCLGPFFEVRTALGRGMGTVVQLATEESPQTLHSASGYSWTVNRPRGVFGVGKR